MSTERMGSAADVFRVKAAAAAPERLARWAVALIVAYTGGLLLVGALGTGVLSHHEVLYSQPAREMLATGDWLVPRLLGQPWMEKPPGTHWANAVAMALTGSTAEWAVRLPSIVASVALALLTAWMTTRWFGASAGLLAGLIQATTLSTLRLGRLAEVEMLLTTVVAAAMGCFALAAVDGPGGRLRARWLPWLFYLAVAASFFFKGLVGPVFILGGCGALALLQRDRAALRFLLDPVGLVIFLAPTVGWSVAAWRECPRYIDTLVLHHFGRFQGDLGGQHDPFYYGYMFLLVMLPWTPLALWGLVQVLRQGGWREPFWRLACCWIAPGLLLLQASSFKASHYVAPLLLPLVILAALGLRHWLLAWKPRRPGHVLLRAAAIVAGCAAGAAVVWKGGYQAGEAMAWLIALIGLGLVVSVYYEARNRPAAYLVTLFALIWIVAAGAFMLVVPHHSSYHDQTLLARRINGHVPPGERLYLIGLWEDQIVYYLKPELVRAANVRQLARRLDGRAQHIHVLATEAVGKELAALGAVRTVDRCPTMKWYLAPRGGRLTLFALEPRGEGIAPAVLAGRRPIVENDAVVPARSAAPLLKR